MSEVTTKKHEHSVSDSNPRFVIDPITMAITTESVKPTLIKRSHNCEVFSFEMLNEKIEGHDMSQCNKVEIHYLNIGSNGDRVEDIYEVKDFGVSEDESKLTFSWLLDGNATEYPGTLAFAIMFKCVDGDTTTYQKPTDKYAGITVKDTINNSDAVAEKYSDILQEWYDKLFSGGIGEAVAEYLDRNPIKVDLSGYAKKEELPKKTSDLTNDSGFLTGLVIEHDGKGHVTIKNATVSEVKDTPSGDFDGGDVDWG